MISATDIKQRSREMAASWRVLNANWLIAFSGRLTLILSVLSVIILAVRFRDLPPLVPVWYSRPWGTDRLANPIFLFLLPVGSMVWYALTILIMVSFTPELLVFAQMLAIGSGIVSAMSFITLLKIVFMIS